METFRAHFCPEAISIAPRRRPKILLIGPSGQVGWELSRSLGSLGHLVCAGRDSTELDLDLAQPAQIRRVVRQVQPQLIVNAAAYTAVDKAETDRDLAAQINSVAPGVLAEEADRAQAALVHYSTDYVFNGSGERPWQEDDPTGPLNHYGATKLAGEDAIRRTDAAHLILRVSWVYGLHGNNFVKTMLRLGAGRQELSIVNDQIGAPTSARVISDITTQILAQARGQWPSFLQQHGGVVHLACQGTSSWHGFAKFIFEHARQRGLPLSITTLKPIPTSAYPTPACRPLNSRMNCQQLGDRFGLQAPAWETALEQSLPLNSEVAPIQSKAA